MLIVLGSYNHDLVWRTARLPQAGETLAGRFSQGPGGKGFNQAMAAHRLGCVTLFVAAIGDDALGDSAKLLAEAAGAGLRLADLFRHQPPAMRRSGWMMPVRTGSWSIWPPT